MRKSRIGFLGVSLLLIFACTPAIADSAADEVDKVVEAAAQVSDLIVIYSNDQKTLVASMQKAPNSTAAFTKFRNFANSDNKFFTSFDLKLKTFKNLLDNYSKQSWDSLVAQTPGNPNYEMLMNFYLSASQWNSVRHNETKMLQKFEGKCWNERTFTTFGVCIKKIPKMQSTLDASNKRLQDASNKMTDSLKAF
jgi:hypothetical protein